MRPAPFFARWQIGPVVSGAFDGRLRLDDEGIFAGHYPGAPILPGSFLVDALFQAVSRVREQETRLAEIVSCRFHSPLLPGDEIEAHFELEEAGAGATAVEVTATGRELAAQLGMIVGSAAGSLPDDLAPASQGVHPVAEGRVLDLAFIERALPHRPPALLVDHALLLDQPGRGPALLAHKTITLHERCYHGADGVPSWSYPPTLVVESFCQACGLLRVSQAPAGEEARAEARAQSQAQSDSKVRVVAKLGNLRFIGEAAPGDQIEHQVRLLARTPQGAVFTGRTVVADRVLMEVGRVVAAVATLSRSTSA